ncbi:hypothetical protein BG011_005450 [Mortierella polycephala]|uniref:Uncharacterized protein n=1 Tax=Mortierella polycephala TaxID=41804 RepID=A0A9P6PX50_9FUNG|nr:hypothetical protein BG011_005450 [Mortierella polycephala]
MSSQAFRVISSTGATLPSAIKSIPTVFDKKTGQNVIIWEDIQAIFKDAEYIKNSDAAVPFLRDGSLDRLVPLRISYHPGVVLDLIVRGVENRASVNPPIYTPVPDESSGQQDTEITDVPTEPQSIPTEQDVISVQVIDIPVPDESSGRQDTEATDVPTEPQSIPTEQDVISVQREDRPGDLYSRIQSVFGQTHELYENMPPRLFIVLPRKCRDGVKRFRLFFLCECGAHVTGHHSKPEHTIHLVQHEGYDLDKHEAFFDKFGSYVLTMLEMVKYGFLAPGITVEPMAASRKLEELEVVRKILNLSNNTWETLVDETISFIHQRQQAAVVDSVSVPTICDKTSTQRMLQDADLKQLRSYLFISDKDRTLGGMYRIATSRGHGGWICMKHYRSIYPESTMERVGKVIGVSEVSLELGKIKVKLESGYEARKFYKELGSTEDVLEMDISLAWHVGFHERNELASAMSAAQPIILSVVMCPIGDRPYPPCDTYTRGYPHSLIYPFSLTYSYEDRIQDLHHPKGPYDLCDDPIIRLMTHGRVQAMLLKNVGYYIGAIDLCSGTANNIALQLRTVNIEGFPTSNPGEETAGIVRMADICPSVRVWRLECTSTSCISDLIGKLLRRCQHLETLTLVCASCEVVVGVSQNKIQTVEARFENYKHDSPSSILADFENLITKLTFRNFFGVDCQNYILDMVADGYPDLSEIDITGPANWLHPNIWRLTTASAMASLKGASSPLRRVVFHTATLGQDSRIEGMEASDEIAVEMTVDFTDPADVTAIEITSHVQMVQSNQRLSSTTTDIFEHYACTITELNIRIDPDDRRLALLDDVTKKKGSKLTTLALHANSLNSTDLKRIEDIIEQSANLDSLSMHFTFEKHEQVAVERLLARCGNRIKSLYLEGKDFDEGIPSLQRLFPSRNSFPKLESFGVESDGIMLNRTCAEWIAAMVVSPMSATSQVPIDIHEPWTPLKNVTLKGIDFGRDSWDSIIRAMDFSTLESLSLERNSLDAKQAMSLVACIPDDGSYVPLNILKLKTTSISRFSRRSIILRCITRCPFADININE